MATSQWPSGIPLIVAHRLGAASPPRAGAISNIADHPIPSSGEGGMGQEMASAISNIADHPIIIEWGGWDGPGNVLAVTVLSGYGYTIQSFWIRYDKDENWYTGTGTPASNQFDAWSVITHEFGHALGLRDTQSIYCPGNATDATMCGQIFRGTTWFRSLEADDRNGVSYLYPR
jgi:hypothetical protein